MTDSMQRFLFDDTDVRGELVKLENSYQDTVSRQHYPACVAKLLGEFLAAATLLSATLKFDGTLTLQARSEGEVPLIMAEATSNHKVRGIAKEAEAASSNDFHTLLKNGQLSITIDPTKGHRYQGIVPLDGNSLAQCLEHYFQQSEQLSTRIWLAADAKQSAGFLLQELPASDISPEQREQQWQHLTHLADTIKREELLELPFEQLLHRLYHQEQVRLFEPTAVAFQCSCSEQRTGKAIQALGQTEANAIIEEQGEILINCEFCHHHYHFDQAAVDKLFNPALH